MFAPPNLLASKASSGHHHAEPLDYRETVRELKRELKRERKEYRRLERAQQAKLERDAADRLAAARIARDAAPPAMRPRHRENILPATRGGEGVRLSPNAGRKVGDSKRIKSIAIEHLARLVDRDYFAASDLLRSTSSSAFA